MSDARNRYITSLQVLRRWLSDHIAQQEHPEFVHLRNKWLGYGISETIATVVDDAASLQLPPAIRITYVTGDAAKWFNPSDANALTPGAAWRVATLEVFDVELCRRWWPLWYEQLVGDRGVWRGDLRRTFPDFGTPEFHKLSNYGGEMERALDRWVTFLAIRPNSNGIVDTPFEALSWRDHCEYFSRVECAHYRRAADHCDLRKADAEFQRQIDRGMDAIRAKYEHASITAHFAKCAVSGYMKQLVRFHVDDKLHHQSAIRNTYRSPEQAAELLRNHEALEAVALPKYEAAIASNVTRLFQLVVPLELEDAPEMPLRDRMAHTEAVAILDKLRKSCIRRMRAEGDPRAEPARPESLRFDPKGFVALQPPAIRQPAEGPSSPTLSVLPVTEIPPEKRLSPGEQADALAKAGVLSVAAGASQSRRLQKTKEVRDAAKAEGLLSATEKVGTAEHVHADEWERVVHCEKGRLASNESQPSVEEIEARKAVERRGSGGWYWCEKCDGRFQHVKGRKGCPSHGNGPWISPTTDCETD